MVVDSSVTLDRVFHALSHPARRAMLRQLTESERSVGELAEPLRMSFQAASKHLRVLEDAALIRRRVDGRTHYCRVDERPLAAVNDWLSEYRTAWQRNFRRLDVLLDDLKRRDKSST